jgi:nucleotide-binding universal stress UspA family protein
MSIKTVMVHAGADAHCDARLRMAADLAGRFGARLVGVGAQAYWPFIDPSRAQGQVRQLVAQAEAELEQTRRRFLALGLPGDIAWRSAVDYPHHALADLARMADLIVAGRSAVDSDSLLFPSIQDLLIQAGIPVLVAPDRYSALSAKTILVAWKNGREARRAVADALPLLLAAERVVVTALAENDDLPRVEREAADVCERLRLHGAVVESQTGPADGNAADRLMAAADACGADLIVAGAYAHSRLQEWVLGGVTRDLLADRSRFVLFGR